MIKEQTQSFLKRRERRLFHQEVKRQIVLGLFIGIVLLIISAVQYFLTQDANDAFWFILMWISLVVVVTSLVCPSLLSFPERVWHMLTQYIGKTLLTVLLTTFYVAVITPVGCLMRAARGSSPFYSWSGSPSGDTFEGWTPKDMSHYFGNNATAKHVRGLFVQLIDVLGYFVRNKQLILLPGLVFLLALGLFMFFLKTSALAPLIYTLF